jgi:hypothetical protein
MMEKFGGAPGNNQNSGNKMSRGSFLKKLGLGIAAVAVSGTEVFGQNSQETKRMDNPRLEKMPDHNLPAGFERMHVYVEINGKKTNVGSANFFESGKSKASFVSNDMHPECFSPEIDYSKVEKVVKGEGREIVLSFAGAYLSPSGNIEGVAYENGVSVGESQHAAYSGVVYFGPSGNMELLRCKDSNDNFDEAAFANIQQRAKNEGGSFYQQKAGIWEGAQKLFPKNQQPFKMRAVCEANDGRKFMINFAEQTTQDQFLKLCLDMKDEHGNPLIKNLLLTDTGECSMGVIRDKNQIASDQTSGRFSAHDMVDAPYENKAKHTNAVVIAK